MKLLIVILLLIPCLGFSQYSKKEIKQLIIPTTCLLVSGACEGVMDYLQFNYTGNSQFWQPRISWTNKYKNGIPPTPAFFGSTTVFVATTDGWHMVKFFRNTTALVGIVFRLGESKLWWEYIIDAAVLSVSYHIGFNITYELLK
jgi:hypothetical protein